MYSGYSNAGVVAAVRRETSRFKVGDTVVSSGNHASYVTADADDLITIPEGLPFDEAAFFALGSIALQGVRKAAIELGESVVVLGQGLVGNLALQLAKLSGGMPVIGVDMYDYRLGKSEECGADYVLNPSKVTLEEKVKEITEGKGANVVIEATGNPEAIPSALELASKYGRVIILGSTRGASQVNFYSSVHKKGVSVIGAHNIMRPRYESSHGWWTEQDDSSLVLKLLRKGLLKVRSLMTAKVSFRRAAEAYRRLIESKDDTLGIILEWKKED
jgi:threonine dehydrogenase-like Zn-dependent dehydrogenase